MRKIYMLLIILIITFALGCESQNKYKVDIGQYEGYKVTKLNINKTSNVLNVYSLKKDDIEIICQEVNSNGYSGIIKSLVYIDVASREVSKVIVLNHTETEDYGGYVTEDWFLSRYNMKKVDMPLKTVIMAEKDTNDIIAITGATITTRAVTKAVNEAMSNFLKIEGDNNV